MIGLVYSRVRTEEKMLLEAFSDRHVKVKLFDPRNLALGHNKNPFKNCSIICNRELSQLRGELILEYIKPLGIRTINDFEAVRVCNNKALCTWMLQKAGIPTPKTLIAFSLEQATAIAEKFSYPVVLKPITGSWGRLIAKAESRDALEAIIEHKLMLNSPMHAVFYIQEYIEKPERDIRVLMVGNEPVAAMYRESAHWITNTANGSSPKKCILSKDLDVLVRKTVYVLGCEIAGVDVIESKSGFKILEVNSTAEFHGLQTVTEINIANYIADYIIRKEKSL